MPGSLANPLCMTLPMIYFHIKYTKYYASNLEFENDSAYKILII